jgi:SAM-dependent methyltransferase
MRRRGSRAPPGPLPARSSERTGFLALTLRNSGRYHAVVSGVVADRERIGEDLAMESGFQDPTALFDEPDLWDRFAHNPHLEERTRIVLEMLPATAQSVLDVGCGNGVLLRALAGSRAVYGIDPSLLGLRAFDQPRVCGLGEALPFGDRSADLVCCLEVLEHLSNEGVRACASELARVARRWLLVATPDREDPRKNALRCPRCRLLFNRSHHLQSFDAERLAGLFPDFEVRTVRSGGQPVRPYPRLLLRLRHHVARRFFKGPGETRGLCPRCGNREFPRFRHNPLSLVLDGINRVLSKRRPYWILLLLERRQAGRIGTQG